MNGKAMNVSLLLSVTILFSAAAGAAEPQFTERSTLQRSLPDQPARIVVTPPSGRTTQELDDILLSEDFEGGLPGDWTVVDGGDGTGDSWFVATFAFGGLTPQYMMVSSDIAGSDAGRLEEELRTPSFSTLGYNSVTLSFDQHFYFNGGNDFAAVDVSIDGGTNWTNVVTYTASVEEAPTLVDLTDYASNEADVMVRFRYDDGGDWALHWLIDNVTVDASTSDAFPPVVTLVSWPDVNFSGDDADIVATATDDSGLNFFNLTYGHVSGGSVIDQTVVAMTATGNPNEYSATIPGAFQADGDSVAWFLLAEDASANANQARRPTQAGTWYVYNVYDSSRVIPWGTSGNFWLEIDTSGTALTLNDEDIIEVVFGDHGFGTFTWYGTSYDRVRVCSNGWISFSSTDATSHVLPAFPDTTEPNNVVSLYGADLNPILGGNIYVGLSQGKFVIEYDNVFAYGASSGLTGEIVLDPTTDRVYLNYESTDAQASGNFTVGYENGAGDLGETIAQGTDWSAIASGTTFRIGEAGGDLTGTVTDENSDPLADADIIVYHAGTSDIAVTGSTNSSGAYTLQDVPVGTYDVTAALPGYVSSTQEGVQIVADQTTTVNFQLAQEVLTVVITGTVMSADTPDTPVEGITVSIPALGVSDVTDAAGAFNLGEQLEGLYTFEIYNTPSGSQGYHDAVLVGVDVSSSTVPLALQVFEILPPTNLQASSGDEKIQLTWTAPANQQSALTVDGLRRKVDMRRAAVERVTLNGSAADLARLAPLRSELKTLESLLALESGERTVDSIDDFSGYVIEQNGTALGDRPIAETYTATGLENFRLYTFRVAADYGYDAAYRVWSDPVEARPVRGAGYEAEVLDSFVWYEINPANGGSGTALDLDDYDRSGMISLGTLTYTHYNVVYDTLNVASDGWISFLNLFGNSLGVLPSQQSPNATIAPYWSDLDPGDSAEEDAWYLVDEANQRVVIQWYSGNYPGPSNNVKSFEAILDCANNTVTLSYESSVDGWEMDDNVVIGVENADGTVAVTYPHADITDGKSVKFEWFDRDFGNIVGTVTEADGTTPVAGASVSVVGYPNYTATTDADGGYELLGVDRNNVPYSMVVTAFGFQQGTASDVGASWPVEQFEITQDFQLDPATSPAAFNLLTPTDGAVVDTDTPTLTWEAAVDTDPGDAVTYDLIYSIDDNTFSDPDTVAGISETSYTFPGQTLLGGEHTGAPGRELDALPNDVTVYWYVHARDTNTNGTLSNQNPDAGTTISFGVHVPNPPNSFGLLTPSDDAVVNATQVELTWEATTDPDGGDVTYDVYVSTDPDNLGSPFVAGLMTTSIFYDGSDDTQYWWTVRAADPYPDYTWANDTLSFSIYVPEPPAAFDLEGPDSGSVINTTTPTLSWGEAVDPDPDDMVTYTLVWADNADFADSTAVTGLDTTAYTIPGGTFYDGETVYWRVWAIDTNSPGTMSGPADYWSFEILINDLPYAFSLLTPPNGTVDDDGLITFTWQNNGDPDAGQSVTYTVYIADNPSLTDPHTFGPFPEGVFFDLDASEQFWLNEDETYYWRVFAHDQVLQGEGTWSLQTRSFSVAYPESPVAFDLVSPADGAVVETTTPTLVWHETTDPDPGDAVTYTVIWSIGDAGFGSPDSAAGLTDTTYTFPPDVLADMARRSRMPRPGERSADKAAPGGKGAAGSVGLDAVPDDATVYWYVAARDGNTAGTLSTHNVDDGNPFSFSVDVPESPGLFSLTSPANGAVVNAVPVTLEWSAAVDPDPGDEVVYDVYVWTDFEGGPGDPVATDLTATTYSFAGAQDDTTYNWNVFARDLDGNEPASANGPRAFTVGIPEPPNAFELASPADGATVNVDNPTVTWHPATDPDPGDAITYNLVYAFTEDFSDSTLVTGLTDTSYTFDEDALLGSLRGGGDGSGRTLDTHLPDDAAVYWYVLAVDGDGLSTHSGPAAYWSFNVYIQELPNNFVLLSPVNNAVDTDGSVEFTWANNGDPDPGQVVTYDLYLSTDPAFPVGETVVYGPYDEGVFPTIDLILDAGFADNDTIRWKVFAQDAVLDDGTWSLSTRRVIVAIPEPPASFTLVGPEDGEVVNTTTPTLIWNPAVDPDPGDAVTYTLYWAFSPDFSDADSVIALTDTTYTFEPTVLAGMVGSGGELGMLRGNAARNRSAGAAAFGSVSPETASRGTNELDEDLPDDATVYWKVRAVDTNSPGTWSTPPEGWSFDVYIPEPPSPFSLLGPADGSTLDALTADFSWEAAADPDPGDVVTYQLELSLDDTFDDPAVYDAGTETSFTVDDLVDDTDYWWRVKAVDTNSDGTYSTEVWTFSTFVPEPPTAFNLVGPVDGDTLHFTTPYEYDFEWTESVEPDPGQGPVTYRAYFHATLETVFDTTVIADGLTSTVVTLNLPDMLELVDWHEYVDVEWWVVAYSSGDSTESDETWGLVLEPDLSVAENPFAGIPQKYEIAALYPNPFNPTTVAVVALPHAADLQVRVYNMLGREVAVLADGHFNAGYHRFTLNGGNLASGIYFVHASVAGKLSEFRKVVLLK